MAADRCLMGPRKKLERGKRHSEFCQGCKKQKCRLLALMRKLKSRGCSHTRGYYHYTRLDDFVSIIKHRRFSLSRVDTMNDGTETAPLSDRTYVLSLSIGDDENISMWSTYGVPRKQAIRIRFPYNAFDTLLTFQSAQNPALKIYVNDELQENPKCKVRLQDVCYVNRKATLFKFGKHQYEVKESDCMLDADKRRAMLSSFWKLTGWQHENETRLVVEFKEPLRGTPAKIGLEFTDPLKSLIQWNGKTPSIMAGPWLDCTRVHKELAKIQTAPDLAQPLRKALEKTGWIEDSQYRGQIHLQRSKMRLFVHECGSSYAA